MVRDFGDRHGPGREVTPQSGARAPGAGGVDNCRRYFGEYDTFRANDTFLELVGYSREDLLPAARVARSHA